MIPEKYNDLDAFQKDQSKIPFDYKPYYKPHLPKDSSKKRKEAVKDKIEEVLKVKCLKK